LYDKRAGVRVLTAEAEALRAAVGRALASNPAAPVLSVLDFGYGSGRVVNEFVEEYRRPLRVIAYDVASAGLRKAAAELMRKGFVEERPLRWEASACEGYVAGTVRRGEIAVVFVHGAEDDSADEVRALLVKANDGVPCLVTCSWYSAVAHIYGRQRRQEFFRALGEATQPTGEMVLAVGSTGDVVAEQALWAARLEAGTLGDAPIEVQGDVLYETELGQTNYYHVFGTDLGEQMAAITGPGQRWWVEGIRLPDDEFTSVAEEQANYRRVVAFNREKSGSAWTADDYRRLHTVAAFRSSRTS
jgi:SAM-dependent methyltransferase